jgi:hypothetical protein
MKPKLCRWIIGYGLACSAPASHCCTVSDTLLCLDHADDWKDIFGDDSLREIPIQETAQ